MSIPDEEIAPRSLGMSGLAKFGGLLCLGLLIVYGVLWSSLVQQSGGAENYVRGQDFLATLTGAAVVAGPQPALLYDPATQARTQTALLAGALAAPFRPYLNPPFAALLLAPLLRAHTTYSLVFTAWAVVTTAAAGLSIGLLAGRWPAPHGTPWLLMLAATSFLPLIASLMLGQQTLLALLGWIGLAAGLKAGRDGIAGAAAALAVFQPETLPLLVLVLLLTRRWRALGGLAATLVLAALAVVPVLGPTWPLAYAGFLLGQMQLQPLVIGAGLLALLLLAAIWVPRHRQGESRWQPATLAWDLRWILTLLAVLPAAVVLQPASLILAIVPGWLLATGPAGGLLPAAQGRFWTLWLLLGYALAPASILLSPAFAWGGVVWWAVAVVGLVLTLQLRSAV